MKLLLDTHILLWALADDSALPRQARLLIENEENSIFFSIASPWEVEIKHNAHPDKLSYGAGEVEAFCKEAGYSALPIRISHVKYLPELGRAEGAPEHRDPFDRIMVCQAAVEGMLFVTGDERVAGYTEPCIFHV